MRFRRTPRAVTSRDRLRSRAGWLLTAATLATGGALSVAADAATPPAYAARAALTPGLYYIGDSTGSVYTFTVKNTGATTSIGALDVVRPASGFSVASCPTPPAGWTATVSSAKCRFRSATSKSDDIKPGASKTFKVKAKTSGGTTDRSGTWSVVVSSANHLNDSKLLKTAGSMGSGLTARLRTFQVTGAVVRATSGTLGAACPPASKSALIGSKRTVVVCGRNRATVGLKPTAAYSGLSGTLVAAKGTFSSKTIAARSANVVLANWAGTTITGTAGAGKTVVAKIGAASNRLSHTTTLPGYTALSNPPVGGADSHTAVEDTTLVVAAPGVLANDTDPDPGTTLTARNASDPAHGTVTLAPDGGFTYAPDANYAGPDSFTYVASDGLAVSAPVTVAITVTPVADAPTAVDDTASTGENATTAIPVLANDSDADGDTVTLTSTDGSTLAGQISVSGGVVTYDPNGQFEALAAGHSGTDTFGYVVSDGALTDAGSVTVTITGVNDAPVAVDDLAYQTFSDTALSVPAPGLLGNDTDVDVDTTLAVTAVGTPANGTVTSQPDGSFAYTPAAGFSGTDTFTYTVSDGTATDTGLARISVVPPNKVPTAANASASGLEDGGAVAVVLSGSDGDGEALTFDVGTASNGLVTVPGAVTCDAATPKTCTASVTYTPNANFFGTDTFTYVVHDGVQPSAAATVTVTVGAVNDAPAFTKGANQTVLEDAGAQTAGGWATGITPGPGEGAQTVSFTVTTSNNALFSALPAVSPAGALTYTSAPHAYGTATVSVKAVDNGGTANGGVDQSATQTFTLTVTPVNDAPIADDETHNPTEDTLGSIPVLTGDVDHDPTDTLTVSGLTNTDANANDGVLAVNPDKTVSYDPRGRFDHLQVGQSEVDTFTYVVSDGNGGSDVGAVTVTVTGVNDNPTATPKAHTAIGNTLLVVNETAPAGVPHTSTTANPLLLGVTDPDDTVFTASAPATTGAGANITHDPVDGSFTFLPAQGVVGPQAFTFTVNDAHGGSDTDTVTVTVSDMVWYVNAAAPAGGSGRSSQPFNALTPITTAGAADTKDGAGDHVFVYSGTYAGGLVLESSQKLWGQPQGLTVAGTALVPPGGTNPVVSNAAGDAITLASSADVQRVDAGASSGVGIRGVSVASATVGAGTTVNDGVALTGAATGTITVGSTIANTSGRAVEVANRSGGAVTFSGNVSDTGTGILLSANTGATVSLTGQLTLSTTVNDAFTATGGGTVVAPHTSNAITTTGGRGVNVQNTVIGASDLVFRSVNVNAAGSTAPANGIVLNNTGATGNLAVLGSGANGSGGTIRNTTGPAVSLTSTRDAALGHLVLQDAQSDGVTGSAVTNLTLTNVRVLGAGDADEERAVDLANMGGTLAITGGLYDDAADDLVKVLNTNTNATVNVTGNATFSNQTQTLAGNAFDFVPNGTSAITATITGNTFSNLKNTSVNWGAGALGSSGASSLTFTSNSVSGGAQGGAGVVVSGQEGTTTTTAINGNTFTGAGGNGVVNHDVNDTSVVLATVQANTFTSPKGHGIVAAVDEDADIRLRVDGNTISNAGGDGIELTNFGDDSASAMTSTAHFIVTNNTINGHSLTPATQFVGGIGLFHFENDADTTCARVTGNTVTGTPAGFYDIFLQDSSNLGKFRFEEVPDTAATGAVSAAYIQSKNTGTAASKIENISAVYSNGVACTNP